MNIAKISKGKVGLVNDPSLMSLFKYFSLLNGEKKQPIVPGSLGLARRREMGMKAGLRANRVASLRSFFHLALFQVIELHLKEPF